MVIYESEQAAQKICNQLNPDEDFVFQVETLPNGKAKIQVVEIETKAVISYI